MSIRENQNNERSYNERKDKKFDDRNGKYYDKVNRPTEGSTNWYVPRAT